MSYHYLQEWEEDCWAADSSDGELLQVVRSANTNAKYCFNDNGMECLIDFQSGMTLEHSTGDRFVDAWILSQPVSPVLPTARPAESEVIKIKETYGLIPSELLKKYDQDSASWKTSLSCYLMPITESLCKNFRRAGIVLNGECYRQRSWEPTITEVDSGSLLATPVASMHKGCSSRSKERLPNQLRELYGGTGIPHPQYIEWMMGWPTGWTGLDPLEMDKYQVWLEAHGIS